MKGQLRLSSGRKLSSPKNLKTRPTTSLVRESVMNILGQKIQRCNWLDLFSGSGVMGCEALHKGAERVIAIEIDKKVAKICHSNLLLTASDLGKPSCFEVINQEAIKWLKGGCSSQSKVFKTKLSNSEDPRFDIVYLDPPYESNLYNSILYYLIEGNWIKKNSIVVCEYSAVLTLISPPGWRLKSRRNYGKSNLDLIIPNQA